MRSRAGGKTGKESGAGSAETQEPQQRADWKCSRKPPSVSSRRVMRPDWQCEEIALPLRRAWTGKEQVQKQEANLEIGEEQQDRLQARARGAGISKEARGNGLRALKRDKEHMHYLPLPSSGVRDVIAVTWEHFEESAVFWGQPGFT